MKKNTLLLLMLLVGLVSSAADYTAWFRDDSKNWDQAYAYAFGGNPLKKYLGDWPGTKMTKQTGSDGHTYWSIKFSSELAEEGNTIIFSIGSNLDQTSNLPFDDGALYNTSGVTESNFDYASKGLTNPAGSDNNNGDLHQPSEWIVGGIPVVYINVYNYVLDANGDPVKENKKLVVDTSALNNEILDKNLDHKNYFVAKYWIDANGSTSITALPNATEETPLTTEIKARGNFTRKGFAKKPFKLKLEDKQNLLGTTSKHYALLAHADDDQGFLRNFVGFKLGKRIGLPWTPEQTPVQVVINGDYRGLYFLTESIRVGDGRIRIEELDDNATDRALISGGYLVELDNYEDVNQISIPAKGSTGSDPLRITFDTPEEYSDVQRQFVTEQFTTMNDLIGKNSDDLWSYMDLDDAARYYIVEELIGHWESYHGSTYLFRDRYTPATETTPEENHKWHFSPLWDCGNAFSTPATTSIVDEGRNHFGNTWIPGLTQNGRFMAKVKETWRWFMQNEYGDILNEIERHSALVKEAAAKDYNRWKGIKPTSGNESGDYRFVVDNTDIDSKATTVKDYLNTRINWLKGKWGEYNNGTYSEPERDTTPAATLPSYVKPAVEGSEHTYTIYFKGDSTPRVWIWDAGNSDKNYTGGSWNNRPSMTAATAANGETYYYYSFTTEDNLSEYVKVKLTNNSGETTDLSFVNGAVYDISGKYTPDFDPDYIAPAAGMSGTLPVLYINVYTDDTKTTLNNEIIDINLGHKNYFSNAEYWLDVNGCEWMIAEGAASIGSKEDPLPLEIKARGNNTRISYSKKPFKLKLGAKQSLLGMSKSKHYAILAHADDPYGFMRNFVGFNLGKRIGLPWTPSQQPVEVVINGDYRGLYFLTESIRVDIDRINITELDDNADNPADLTGGYLVELDNYKDDPATIVISEDGPLYVTPDTPEIYSYPQKKFITEQFTGMDNLIKAHNREIWKYIQLDDAARYYLVEEIIGHYEAYHGSTYLFRDKAPEGENADPGKWSFSPLWDCGHAFDTPESEHFYDHAPYGTTWIKDMLSTAEFSDKVKETWLWFMQNEYNGLVADIENYAAHIAEAAKSDYDRWYGVATPDEVKSPSGYPSVPEESCHNENRDMAERATYVKNYLNNRLANMKGWFGDYNNGTHSEPARDNRESAPLPDYVKPGYESTATTYTIYFKGDFTPGIWIWDAGNGDKNYTGGSWNNRPSMTAATAANGEPYYYYSFTTEDNLSEYVKVIFTNETAESKPMDFVNGALYSFTEKIKENFDPDYIPPLPDHNLSTDPVYIYVYDKAGWDHVDMWLYVDGGDDYTTSESDDRHNINGDAWPGKCLTDDGTLFYDTYKGLYYFEVPSEFQNGRVIFSNKGNSQYPGSGQAGLEIGGKSHLFINSDNKWIEILPHESEPEYSATIPVLMIETADKAPITDTENYVAGASISILEGTADANYIGTAKNFDFSIKGRGTTSWTDYAKKPYRLKFDKRHSIGSMPASKHWLLMPFASDAENGMLANPVGHKLAELSGMEWSPKMEGVELVINGEYQGLYFITEQIRPDMGVRVNIHDTDEEGYDPKQDWIVEIDNYYIGTDYHYSWTDDTRTNYMIPSSPELADFITAGNTEDNYRKYYTANAELLIGAVTTACDTDDDGWDKTWKDVIDDYEAYRFYLVQELMDDIDGFNTNFYIHHTSGSKWKFGPVWNFEKAFNSKASKNSRIYDRNSMTWAKELYFNRYFRVGTIMMLDRLTGNEDSPADQHKEIQPGSPIYPIFDFIDEFVAKYSEAFDADRKHWINGYEAAEASTAATRMAILADGDTAPSLSDYGNQVKSYLIGNADYLLNDGRNDNGGTTGIGNIDTDDIDAPAEYFNLQGIRIDNPAPGSICIVRRGTSVTKELVR